MEQGLECRKLQQTLASTFIHYSNHIPGLRKYTNKWGRCPFHILELIHWFSKDLLSTYYVPNTIQGMWVAENSLFHWERKTRTRRKMNEDIPGYQITMSSIRASKAENGERDGAERQSRKRWQQSSQWNGTVNREKRVQRQEDKPRWECSVRKGKVPSVVRKESKKEKDGRWCQGCSQARQKVVPR